MLSISKNYNPNYLAKVVKIKSLRKHENADRLQICTVDFQNVIVSIDTKVGDLYIYFPVESKINSKFLAFTNSFRHKELNDNKETIGFFEDNCRVKAVKLRSEKSMGYLVPVDKVEEFIGSKINFSEHINEEFDTLGDILMVEKYMIPTKGINLNSRQGKKPRVSRLVEGQFHFHVDTENLRNNAHQINPEDNISVTYKIHGTSVIVGNILVKKKLHLFEKILRFIGIKIIDTEYDYIYSSRKVVKNCYENKDKKGFYDSDIWGIAKEELKEFIPKGFTFYCEIAGFMPSGLCIQKKYDYGFPQGKHGVYVYRITFTNADGIVIDLSTDEIREFAKIVGFEYVPHFFTGKAKDLFPEIMVDDNWLENFIIALEKKYNDKDCYMCKNSVPEEGIVVRKESMYQFESYKLKSFSFLQHESKMLDEGVEDLESNN